MTTTPNIEGHKITEYKGIVTGQSIIGAQQMKAVFDKESGAQNEESRLYEDILRQAKEEAFRSLQVEAENLGANALVGVAIDIKNINASLGTGQLMVTVSGTAIIYM